MKSYIWVVELRTDGCWVPESHTAMRTRDEARGYARAYAKEWRGRTRVRKYGRVE